MWIVHWMCVLSYSCDVKQLFTFTFNFYTKTSKDSFFSCLFFSNNPSSTNTQGKLVKEIVIMSLMILLMMTRRMQKVSLCWRNCFLSLSDFNITIAANFYFLPSAIFYTFIPFVVTIKIRFFALLCVRFVRIFCFGHVLLTLSLIFSPLIFFIRSYFGLDSLENRFRSISFSFDNTWCIPVFRVATT